MASLKKQVLTFLSDLEWKKLASPLVELVIPNLIQKCTLPEIGNFTTFNNLSTKNKSECDVKCNEQPEPFELGEKISIKGLSAIRTTTKKKSSLQNAYLPIKKGFRTKLQTFIPYFNQDHTLDKIRDFRHVDDGLDIEYNFSSDRKNLSSCETLLMGNHTSQELTKQQATSLPLVEMESGLNLKVIQREELRKEKPQKIPKSTHLSKSSVQLKNKQSTYLPPKTNQNRRDILNKNKVRSTNSYKSSKVPVKQKQPLLLKEKEVGIKKICVKKVAFRNKSKNIQQSLKCINNELNLELKESLIRQKDKTRRKEKSVCSTKNKQEQIDETDCLRQTKKNFGLVKTEKLECREICSAVKVEDPGNQASNQTPLGTILESPTSSKSKPLQCESQSNGYEKYNSMRQSTVQKTSESTIAGLSKSKTNLAHASLSKSSDSKLLGDYSCIKDITSMDSKDFKGERDWMQRTRCLLRELQKPKIVSGNHQKQNVEENNKTNLGKILVVSDAENIKQREQNFQESTKTLSNNKTDVVIKSNFVVFDTHGKSGNLLVQEQSVGLGKGVRNNLISFEHVLKGENARQRLFNKSNQKCAGKQQKIKEIRNNNGSTLKSWRRLKEMSDVNIKPSNYKNVSFNIGGTEETLKSKESSDTNVLKNSLTKSTLENGLINNFNETSITKNSILKEKENNKTKTDLFNEITLINSKIEDKGHKITLNKNTSLQNIQELASGKSVEQAETDNYDTQMFENPPPVKANSGQDNLSFVNNNKKLEDVSAINLNHVTQPTMIQSEPSKSKLLSKNSNNLENKHIPQAKKSPLKTAKCKSDTKASSLLPVDSYNRTDTIPTKKVELKKENSYHNQTIKDSIKTDQFDVAGSKNIESKSEAEKNAGRSDKDVKVLKKTVSSLTHSTSKVSEINLLRKTASTSVDILGERHGRDTAQCNTVNTNKNPNDKSINKVHETLAFKTSLTLKENKPKISKTSNKKSAQRAQSENIKHINYISNESNNNINRGHLKSKADMLVSKSNLEHTKQPRDEMKLSKSASLNYITTGQKIGLEKTYRPRNKLSTEKIMKIKTKSGIQRLKTDKQGKVEIRKEDSAVKVQDNKIQVAAETYSNCDPQKGSPRKHIVKQKSDLNLSSVELNNLNSKKVLKVKSYANLDEHKDIPLVEKLNSKSKASRTNVLKTVLVVSKVKVSEKIPKPMNETAGKSPNNRSKSTKIDTNNIVKEPKNIAVDINEKEENSKKILKLNEVLDSKHISTIENPAKNLVLKDSRSSLSEKKKLKNKLSKLLQGLSVTGHQQKFVQIQSRVTSKENIKKNNNAETFLQDTKKKSIEAQATAKTENDDSYFQVSKQITTAKSEVLTSKNYDHKIFADGQKPVFINVVEEEKGQVVRKAHKDADRKMNEAPNISLTGKQKSSVMSKIKSSCNNTANKDNKVKLNARLESVSHDESQTKIRNTAKISHPPRISKVITQPSDPTTVNNVAFNNKPYNK